MDITFTVETTNGKTWTATCADPVLEVEGADIISVSKLMAQKIEKWFIDTFNTTKRVVVEVPAIKAKVKANVSVRAETPLSEFKDVMDSKADIKTTLVPCVGCGVEILVREGDQMLCEACAYDRSVNAKKGEISDDLTGPRQKALPLLPCGYMSDGSVLPTGMCEATSNTPGDTPGLLADQDGTCLGEFAKCSYYKSGGIKNRSIHEDDETYGEDEIDEYGSPEDSYR